MSTNNIHHSIDYIEFGVTDMEKTKAFYSAAFDREFTDYAPGYVGIKRENGEAGGFTLKEKVTTGGPLIVLYSNDIETSYSRVREAGGEITKETFEFPGGRRFEFLDPNGNQLAVWST